MERNTRTNVPNTDVPGENDVLPNQPVVAFTLTPAAANSEIIYYKIVSGRKVKDACMKKLTDDLFDCVPENLFTFIKALKDQSRDYEWNGGIGILDILRDPTNVISQSDDLLEAYGTITLVLVRAIEKSYIKKPIRAAQDTYNLYLCLINSMSDIGKSKVLIW